MAKFELIGSIVILLACVFTCEIDAGAEEKLPIQVLIVNGQKAIEAEDMNRAKKSFEQAVEQSKSNPHSSERWSALMADAWFDTLVGDFTHSIDLSTDALELSYKLGDPYRIGRSLCWLGWAFSSTGHYEVAKQFYQQAVEQGAPKGKIAFPAVWGLATQELGTIAFKMGEVGTAKSLLTTTVDFARKNQITIGISEGAVALGEIALATGNLNEADSLADEAVQASYECNCNPSNTARALIFKGTVSFQQAGNNEDLRKEAVADLQRALNYARTNKLKPNIAEALIGLAALSEVVDAESRSNYLNEAIALVRGGDFETKGMAFSEAARNYLATNSVDLAARYVKSGLKVTSESLRATDVAYLLTQQSLLEALGEKQSKAILSLSSAIDLFLGSGNLVSATEN